MIFEQATNQYLLELKNQNVLIDAYVTGVNESFESSTCIGRFLEEDQVVREKQIVVYKEGEDLVWSFLETLQPPFSE